MLTKASEAVKRYLGVETTAGPQVRPLGWKTQGSRRGERHGDKGMCPGLVGAAATKSPIEHPASALCVQSSALGASHREGKGALCT